MVFVKSGKDEKNNKKITEKRGLQWQIENTTSK